MTPLYEVFFWMNAWLKGKLGKSPIWPHVRLIHVVGEGPLLCVATISHMSRIGPPYLPPKKSCKLAHREIRTFKVSTCDHINLVFHIQPTLVLQSVWNGCMPSYSQNRVKCRDHRGTCEPYCAWETTLLSLEDLHLYLHPYGRSSSHGKATQDWHSPTRLVPSRGLRGWRRQASWTAFWCKCQHADLQ